MNILDMPDSVKETMRENAFGLVEIMLLEGTPFRLVLWNLDNWDYELPPEVIEKFPIQIILDIKNAALEESYVDDNTGEIIINTYFNNSPFSKMLRYDEILAVLDENGNPLIVNNFKPNDGAPKMKKNIFSKEDIIKMVALEGVSEENAIKSIEAFSSVFKEK